MLRRRRQRKRREAADNTSNKKMSLSLYWKCLVIALCGLVSLVVVFQESPQELLDPKNVTTTVVMVTNSTTTKILAPPPPPTPISASAADPTADVGHRKCAKNDGFIIANMHGRLGNNLFQIALANRLSKDLCWPVIYKEGWQGIFPHAYRANHCFPFGIKAHERNSSNGIITKWDQEWFDLMQIDEATNHTWATPEQFYKELPRRRNNEIYEQWLDFSMQQGTSLNIMSRFEFDYTSPTGWDNDLVERLRNPGNQTFVTNINKRPPKRRLYNKVRAIQMNSFYIHYEWIKPWLADIKQWNVMNEVDCCQTIPPPNAVVVHVRNFEDGENLNPKFTPNVYFEVLDRFYFGSHVTDEASAKYILWIVCQPQDMEIELIQQLQARYGSETTKVVSGQDPYDAFCILRKASNLILSTHSTFSQMAALLGDHHHDTNNNHSTDSSSASTTTTNVHYLLPKLKYPKVTLVVPNWNYHLVEPTTKNTIQTWNVRIRSIESIMS